MYYYAFLSLGHTRALHAYAHACIVVRRQKGKAGSPVPPRPRDANAVPTYNLHTVQLSKLPGARGRDTPRHRSTMVPAAQHQQLAREWVQEGKRWLGGFTGPQ